MRSVVGLIDLISGEVGGVNVGGKLRLEWCTDSAKRIKLDSTEEFVVFDFLCRDSAKTMLGITDKTEGRLVGYIRDVGSEPYLRIKFSASGPSWTSSGKYRDCRQLTIFL
jgi:hypothetical protein